MSFLLQRIEGGRVGLLQIDGTRLRIGRGTNAELRSENAAVALEHAIIELVEERGYEIRDRGSITGTYVNGSPVETAPLAPDDRIEIGDLLITVKSSDPSKPMFLRVERERDEAVAASEDQAEAVYRKGAAMKAPRIDFLGAYQLRRGILSKPGLVVSLAILAIIGLITITVRGSRSVYQPGALSVAHASALTPDGTRVIGESDCQACHIPFGGPSNEKCLDCHQDMTHQVSQVEVGNCISCHAEHRDIPRLAAIQHQECVECHTSIDRFDHHPQFAIETSRGRMEVTSARLEAPSTIRFDHECHLRGECSEQRHAATVATGGSPDCADCHQFDPESGTALQVSYDEACESCHPLTFDNRFEPLPHKLTLRSAAAVIANAYSGNEALLGKTPTELSRIFASRKTRPVNQDLTIVRNAQRVMEVRCRQCHVMSPDGTRVLPVRSNPRWFASMRAFDHSVHMSESLGLKCETCHPGYAASEVASDLSLPPVAACAGCHTSSAEFEEAALGACMTCHSYHSNRGPVHSTWPTDLEENTAGFGTEELPQSHLEEESVESE